MQTSSALEVAPVDDADRDIALGRRSQNHPQAADSQAEVRLAIGQRSDVEIGARRVCDELRQDHPDSLALIPWQASKVALRLT